MTWISIPRLTAISALVVTAASNAIGAPIGFVDLGFRDGGVATESPGRSYFPKNFIPAGDKRFCAVKSLFTTPCSANASRQQRLTADYDMAVNKLKKKSEILGKSLPLFQTRWFLVLCWLVAHTSAFSFHRRMTNATKYRIDARLQERQRIARELHDTLMQSAQGLILSFQGIADELPRSAAMRLRMEAALDQAESLLREARNHVSDLRMICLDGNVAQALSRTAHEFMMAGSVDLRVISEGSCRAMVENVADDIYRIGREALTNAFMHADAKTILLQTMYTSSGFTLRIQDDGRGIDSKILALGSRAHHFGLEGMRERATRIGAKVDILSSANRGTQIELRVPSSIAYRDAQETSCVGRVMSLLAPTSLPATISHLDGRLAKVR